MSKEKVSIIMLTYNAPNYVKTAVESIAKKTKGVEYELVVVDNHSGLRTRLLLKKLEKQKKIDRIQWNDKNLLFAKGNNAGSRLASPDVTHYLLINSDVEIRKENWLKKLVDVCPEGGICAYGLVENEPVRADGYCMLISKELYQKYELDENYEWFWSITKIQAQALAEGKRVIAIRKHNDMIYHFGGKSGKAFRFAKGMNEKKEIICSWFEGHHVEILEQIEDDIFE